MYEVNERGLAEIREALVVYTKAFRGWNPGDVPTASVYAYADIVESDSRGDFEIRASQSVTGCPIVVVISDTGIDVS